MTDQFDTNRKQLNDDPNGPEIEPGTRIDGDGVYQPLEVEDEDPDDTRLPTERPGQLGEGETDEFDRPIREQDGEEPFSDERANNPPAPQPPL